MNHVERSHFWHISATKTLLSTLALLLLAHLLASCGSSSEQPVAPLGSDASLSSLSISGITLEPEFSPSLADYTAAVRFPSKSTLVTATAADINATINVNGGLVASGSASDPIALDEGGNTITVSVTAEDKTTEETYTIHVDRQSASEFEFAQKYLGVPWFAKDAELWIGYQLALSADGETLAAGDPEKGYRRTWSDPEEGTPWPELVGSALVLNRTSAGFWGQQAELTNAEADDYFGVSTALSEDGSTLAVGAPLEDSAAIGVNGDQGNNDANTSGAVYVYVRDDADAWTQQAYIKASNTDADDRFGWNIALSDDGATLAVSAIYEASAATGVNGDETDNTAPWSGAVYVFTRHSGGVWAPQAYIKAANTDADDRLGSPLSLSRDGATLAVGGSHNAGSAVYVFTRDGGSTWAQQAVIRATNAERQDGFASSVVLSENGNTLAVGAYLEDSAATGVNGNEADNGATDSGAAYVFTRDNAGNWTQQAYIKASNTDARDSFGQSLALSADGSMLIIGSRYEGSAAIGVNGDDTDNSAGGSGAVYVFTRDKGDVWTQRAYIKPSTSEQGQQFGSDVAVSGDGTILVVDAEGDIGAIHFFEL